MAPTQWTAMVFTPPPQKKTHADSCGTRGVALRLKVTLFTLSTLFSRYDQCSCLLSAPVGENCCCRAQRSALLLRDESRRFHLQARVEGSVRLLYLRVLRTVHHQPFIFIPPTSWAPWRPSLAAAALSLITR